MGAAKELAANYANYANGVIGVIRGYFFYLKRSEQMKPRTSHAICAMLTILLAGLGLAARAQDEHAGHAAGGGFGTVHFETSCSPAAQQQFDRAVWIATTAMNASLLRAKVNAGSVNSPRLCHCRQRVIEVILIERDHGQRAALVAEPSES